MRSSGSSTDGPDARSRRPRERRARPTSAAQGEWCAVLERDRSALFERVQRADPAAQLGEGIEHGMFGPLNWRETLLFLRVHDLDHAGQLQKLATALTVSRPA